MNACKEDSCYVTLNYDQDMKISQFESTINLRKNPDFQFRISRDYVLPDFTTIRRGFLKPANETGLKPKEDSVEQNIRLNNERFAVPELLFNPTDVGIDQCGIAETIVASVMQCDPEAQPWLFRNIILTGGNACLQNFRERVERDVRALAPDLYDINVRSSEDSISSAWLGGSALAKDPVFTSICVTKDEYLERGHSVCHERYYL